ncbi:MAG: hypothetical protein RLY61_817 [Candidatus Parcubacteria bacterium]|jgi:hypothetical protein
MSKSLFAALREASDVKFHQLGLHPRDRLEAEITILPEPVGHTLDGVEILDWGEVRIGQICRTAEIMGKTGASFKGLLPVYELVTEGDSTINRSTPCALCTLSRAVSNELSLDYVLSNFAYDIPPFDAFERLAQRHGLGSRLETVIDGQMIVDLANQDVMFLMQLNPDAGADSQTVLVVSAKCQDRKLRFLVANSYPNYPIEGMVEEINPGLVWVDAVSLAQQCISLDPNTPTIQVYKLDRPN